MNGFHRCCLLDALTPSLYRAVMKVDTTISLSSELLAELDRHSGEGDRSEFIERALWNYLDFLRRMDSSLHKHSRSGTGIPGGRKAKPKM